GSRAAWTISVPNRPHCIQASASSCECSGGQFTVLVRRHVANVRPTHFCAVRRAFCIELPASKLPVQQRYQDHRQQRCSHCTAHECNGQSLEDRVEHHHHSANYHCGGRKCNRTEAHRARLYHRLTK